MSDRTKERNLDKAACDDWTKIPVHCAECSKQYLRKVRHQHYCDEHRHLAGAVIRPQEAATSKDLVSAVREAYGQTLDRDAHGVGHYEDCWKDHYPCLIELLLSEIGELRFHVSGLKTENAAFAEREATQSTGAI